MKVLIDNYDSFTYNLYQQIGVFDPEIIVVKNDEITLDDLKAMHPSHLILSPGPGRPEDSGISLAAARYFANRIPMLGVCMGLEVICEALGGQLKLAKTLMHGKSGQVTLDTTDPLFRNCPTEAMVARYHSLVCDGDSLPGIFNVPAYSADGDIMALTIPSMQIYGMQFHPESVMTEPGIGDQMIQNFLQASIASGATN